MKQPHELTQLDGSDIEQVEGDTRAELTCLRCGLVVYVTTGRWINYWVSHECPDP